MIRPTCKLTVIETAWPLCVDRDEALLHEAEGLDNNVVRRLFWPLGGRALDSVSERYFNQNAQTIRGHVLF